VFLRNIRWKPDAPFYPNGKSTTVNGKPVHPVFASFGLSTRTPLLESDYNLHKSNSTYFSDLDIARTALATRILSPGVGILSKELDQETIEKCSKEGKPVPKKLPWMYIAVGSVYCSFKREIKPFELVDIQSKAVAWDEKWLYVLSFYIRPAKKGGDGKKTLLATALTKYVVKKGRLTVPPERVLRTSGFLPPRPESAGEAPVLVESKDVSGIGTPAEGEGLKATAAVDDSLVREVLKIDADQERETLEEQKKANSESWSADEWTWERIEQERLRGLKVVEGYSTLDVKLQQEWEYQ